jgi:NADH-quinone oxidoreductase subunit L
VASGFSRKSDEDHGHGAHAHGHAPHEAPWSMALPLIFLAIGSALAGYVGVPHALGGSNRIESFLEPSFEVHAAPSHETTAAGVAVVTTYTDQSAPDAHAAEAPHADAGTELMLMAISSGVAFAGIGLAVYFWLRNRRAADQMAQRFAPIHRLLLNKYYVDEIYEAAIVQPIKAMSTGGLWKGVDAALIDGAVNGVGFAVGGSSGALRRTQTGSVRTYAFALFAGAVAILGYYLFQ